MGNSNICLVVKIPETNTQQKKNNTGPNTTSIGFCSAIERYNLIVFVETTDSYWEYRVNEMTALLASHPVRISEL